MLDPLPQESLDEREKRILAYWQQHDTFRKSVEGRRSASPFITYDGPPFATGLPHYGHFLAGTIKDVVLRYKTMQGYYVPRRFGWDCHGLPVENEIEKAEGLTGSASIEAFGIARFNEACRSIVDRYSQQWEAAVARMGRWVDFSDCYRTMDRPYMESVWWVFKQLFDQGLVYEGFRVMPYSAKLGTPLSNFEAGENYKEVDDPSLFVAFESEENSRERYLIWTTTPWTLLSNLAIMVGPQLRYLRIVEKATGLSYWIAESRVGELFADEAAFERAEVRVGEELVGRRYKPLFDYFAERKASGAFRLLAEPTIALDEGTGLVHAAPAFGEVDFYCCQREGIELACPVDNNGHFTAEVAEYQGLFVKEADKPIIARLKAEGKLFRQATCHHRYPFCWRSDTPLIYKAVRTWFVAVEQIKDKIISTTSSIHWVPSHLKEGRFGKWIETARDWNISRNRYWGTPIPLWRSSDGELLAIGSTQELEELSGCAVNDLHRHHIDQIVIERDGKSFYRIPEVFDCWFESGSMPYAQSHYPFEEQKSFVQRFPADFIAEGIDQTRAWFYTLSVLSAALFEKPAFKNVIANGIVLASDGNKMSKRLRNYPDPGEVISRYGADAVRLYMMHSPASRAESLCFSEEGVALVVRQLLLPWWNSYSFFITYARICSWQPPAGDEPPPLPSAPIDRWILAQLNRLISQVQSAMDDYQLSAAVEPLVTFIESLTNWYIRRSRRRFWESDATPDRQEAFSTLYFVLVQLCKVAAPFVPFMAEAMYLNLCDETMASSVHLSDFPVPHPLYQDERLERSMELVQTLVSLGHSLRKEQKLKVRQPLRRIVVASADQELLSFAEENKELLQDELNVKELLLSTNERELVELKVKPNFRLLGKKVGNQMKAAQEQIEQLKAEHIEALLQGKELYLTLADGPHQLTPDDLLIARSVKEGCVAATAEAITLLLDTQLDEELLCEGIAREIVNKVNTLRRELGLEVTDRICLRIQGDATIQGALAQWGNYIIEEVLACELTDRLTSDGATQQLDLNGHLTQIEIAKAF